MRRESLTLVVMVTGAVLLTANVLGRGGRGGGGFSGGGMGGGGARGGASSPAINRSPSMSRPTMPATRPSPTHSNTARPNPTRPNPGTATGPRPNNRPAGGTAGTGRPSAGVGQGSRPSASQLNQFLEMPGTGATRPSGNTGPRTGDRRPIGANPTIADFLQGDSNPTPSRTGNLATRNETRPATSDRRGPQRDTNAGVPDRLPNRTDRLPARVDDRGEFRNSLTDGRTERRTDRQQALGDHADHIRDEIDDHYDHNHLFDNFWDNHPHAHYQFHQNPVYWTWASFGTVRTFLPWGWGTEVYYDYGTGGNVYYMGDTVYVGEKTVPADEYAEQAEQIATNVPKVEKPQEMEWLPLGVFALTQDSEEAAVPNMFLQLAVSKEGILAGTYQNKSTGETESVEGMVDQQSQRTAWTIVGKNTPIMETGLANLTRNEARVLVHFADGQTQTWLLVRIEKPADTAAKNP